MAAARSPRLSKGPKPNPYLRIVTALCDDQRFPLPVAELQFNADRRWRFDLAWPQQWLAVEVQGGAFAAGRHVRGAALRREYEKLNNAQTRGWVVLQVLPEQVTNGVLTAALAAYFTRWYPSRYPPR